MHRQDAGFVDLDSEDGEDLGTRDAGCVPAKLPKTIDVGQRLHHFFPRMSKDFTTSACAGCLRSLVGKMGPSVSGVMPRVCSHRECSNAR